MRKLMGLLCLALGLCKAPLAAPITYNNVFISYVSAPAAQSIANYVIQKKLRGMFMWEIRGDTNFNESTSLLNSISSVLNTYSLGLEKPLIMGYWSDWNVYSMDNTTRAIPEPAYGVPGSIDINGVLVVNQDFSHKLEGLNVIVYSFIEAQSQSYTYLDHKTGEMVTVDNKTPDAIGTLYFKDPRSDLAIPGSSPVQDAFCKKNTAICSFALSNRITPLGLNEGAKMGNFNAFAQLHHVDNQNPLGPLRKIISVGGVGHDASFEDAFNSPNGIDNFVNSAKVIIDGYQLDGIDLDYENPQMTAENAEHFVLLIKKLKMAMPDKIISMTILSSPAYLNGTENGQYGFSKGTLSEIAKYITYVNLMTFDFYGAYNFTIDGTGTTAFLTNLTIPFEAPATYLFSIDLSVNAALKAGIAPSQLSVGIPAYGRALAGISSERGGLFQPILSSATIPRGDLDLANCQTTISPLGPNSCTGSFQYKYIIRNMLNQGFTEINHLTVDQIIIGTTAYATSWTQPLNAGFQLQITNIGQVGDTAFNLMIGDFVPTDFFNVGFDQTYDSGITTSINGQNGLVVRWTTSWGPQGQCNSNFDFNQNMHLMIRVTPDNINGTYITTCTSSPLPNPNNAN